MKEIAKMVNAMADRIAAANLVNSSAEKVLKKWDEFQIAASELEKLIQSSNSADDLFSIARKLDEKSSSGISLGRLWNSVTQKANKLDVPVKYYDYTIRRNTDGKKYVIIYPDGGQPLDKFNDIESAKKWIDGKVKEKNDLIKNTASLLKKLGIENAKYESYGQKRGETFDEQTHYLKDDRLALKNLQNFADGCPDISKWKVIILHNQQVPEGQEYRYKVRSENEFDVKKGDRVQIKLPSGHSFNWGAMEW